VTFPTFVVEMSPGTGPFDTPSWVDISDRFLRATIDVGRDDELSGFPPGECTLVLRNTDRQLDPEYTAGTYFGDLNPRVPFRLRVTHSAVTYDLFYGFVENGFEQTYDPPNWATCTVRLVDILGVVNGTPLPQSAYVGEVLADSPTAYWKLDEATGVVMRDYSGNGNHGTYDNVAQGEDSLVIDADGHSIFCVHVGDNRGQYKGATLPTAAPVTLEAWVKFDRDLTETHVIMAVQRDSALASVLYLSVTTSGLGSPNGELLVTFVNLGGNYKARGHTRVDDGQPHHVAMTMATTAAADIKLYVDGVLQTKTVVSGTTGGSWPSHLIWTLGNFVDSGFGDFGIDGLIDEAAVYPSALSAARILAHYQAGATAFSDETSGARINRVLDIIGVPAGLRDIATGDTTVGPANYSAGSTAGRYLARVVESEQGYLYVDHRNGGKITFRGRYNRLTATRSITPQATFTDDTGVLPAGSYPYTDIKVDPNGIDSIINAVSVNWRGGVTQVTDDASIATYGPQQRTITTEAPSSTAAASAGNWMIRQYANPQVRVRSLDIAPGRNQEILDAIVDLRVSDRVAVKRRPQLVGAAVTNGLILEGLKHVISPADWTCSVFLSNADDSAVWIWGTSKWGETTIWG